MNVVFQKICFLRYLLFYIWQKFRSYGSFSFKSKKVNIKNLIKVENKIYDFCVSFISLLTNTKYCKALNSAPQIFGSPKIFCTLNSAPPPKILENHYVFFSIKTAF